MGLLDARRICFLLPGHVHVCTLDPPTAGCFIFLFLKFVSVVHGRVTGLCRIYSIVRSDSSGKRGALAAELTRTMLDMTRARRRRPRRKKEQARPVPGKSIQEDQH